MSNKCSVLRKFLTKLLSAGTSALKVCFAFYGIRIDITSKTRVTSLGGTKSIFQLKAGSLFFSRTGKRDLSGLLNDGVNSLAR